MHNANVPGSAWNFIQIHLHKTTLLYLMTHFLGTYTSGEGMSTAITEALGDSSRNISQNETSN